MNDGLFIAIAMLLFVIVAAGINELGRWFNNYD